MKHNPEPLERISLIISCLLKLKEKNSDNLSRVSLSELSTAAGLPTSLLKDDLVSLSEYPFFCENITVADAAGKTLSSKEILSCHDELFINIDADMFHYGYEEDKIAVMLTADEQMLLLPDAKYYETNAVPKKAALTPLKVRIKISDTTGTVINKLRSDSVDQTNTVFTHSNTDESVWYCEDIITDKLKFFKKLFGYGTSVVILEPDSLIEEYTELLKKINEKL